jgi:hypothetical protein
VTLFPVITSQEERERIQAARARRAGRPNLAAWANGLPPHPTHDMSPQLRRMYQDFLSAASGPLAGREASTAEGGGEGNSYGPGTLPAESGSEQLTPPQNTTQPTESRGHHFRQ